MDRPKNRTDRTDPARASRRNPIRRPLESLALLLGLVVAGCPAEDLRGTQRLPIATGRAPSIGPAEEHHYERSGSPPHVYLRGDHLRDKKPHEVLWGGEAISTFQTAVFENEVWPGNRLYLLHPATPGRLIRWQGELDLIHASRTPEGEVEISYRGGGPRPKLLLDRVSLGKEPPDRWEMSIDVAVQSERVLVVYSPPVFDAEEPSSLRQIQGTLLDDRPHFGSPETIFEGIGRVEDIELLAMDDRLALLWQTEKRLSFSFRPLVEGGWSRPRELSASSRPESASAAFRGRDVYVAWSDTRFKEIDLFEVRNSNRLLAAHSPDGGGSFGQPRLIGPLGEDGHRVFSTYVTFSGDIPLIYYDANSREIQWGLLALEPSLARYWPTEPVSSTALFDGYRAWLDRRYTAELAAASAYTPWPHPPGIERRYGPERLEKTAGGRIGSENTDR